MSRPEEIVLEAAEADTAEQEVDALPNENDDRMSPDPEAPEWDAQEQSRVVPFEDEYR